MAVYRLPREVQGWVRQQAGPLYGRPAWRLGVLLPGLLFATGWHTVGSWLRGPTVGKLYRAYDYFLSALGRQYECLAGRLLRLGGDWLGSRWPYKVCISRGRQFHRVPGRTEMPEPHGSRSRLRKPFWAGEARSVPRLSVSA
jgi:hypothetical protein